MTHAPLVAAIVLALPATAFANMGGYRPRPSRIGGPRAAPTPLVVESERLVLDCHETARDADCSFEATYRIHNPTDAREEVVGAFYGVRTRDVRVSVDGRDVGRELDEEERARVDRASPGLVPGQVVIRTGFAFSVEARATVQAVARGTTFLERSEAPHELFEFPASYGRHLLLGSRDVEPHAYVLEYWVSPIRAWGGVGAIEVEIRAPASWTRRDVEADDVRWTDRSEDDARISRARFDGQTVERLEVVFDRARPWLALGGLVVGVGGRSDDEGGFRMRIAVELARREWMFFGLGGETDFRDRVLAVPYVTIATPWYAIVPSIGITGGVPVALAPAVRAGLRIGFDAMLGAFGFAATWDFFPGRREPELVQTTLLGVVSL